MLNRLVAHAACLNEGIILAGSLQRPTPDRITTMELTVCPYRGVPLPLA